MYNKLAITVLVTIGIVNYAMGIEDGDFLKITNVADGNVLTVTGTDPLEEASIKSEPWRNLPTQKWLVVQAVVASDNCLLIPQRQHWNWNRFIRNGVVPRQTKDRDGDLPDWTMVLTAETRSGNLIQQARHGKGNQQWKSVDVKLSKGKILIKSIANGKCLRNSGTLNSGVSTSTTASPSFLQNARAKIQSVFGRASSTNDKVETKTDSTSTTILSDCDELDKKQQWSVEQLTDLQL